MKLLVKKRMNNFILIILPLTWLLVIINPIMATEITDFDMSNNSKLTINNDKLTNSPLELSNTISKIKTTKTDTKSIINRKKSKLTISTHNLNKNYGDSKKFKVKITKNGTGVPNIKILLTLNSKKYYKITDDKGIVNLDINLKIGKYIIKSVIYNNNLYYSKINTNKIIVHSQNPYKLNILKWGSKGNIKKNKVLLKNIPKTPLTNNILNICKKGTPVIQFGNGSGKKVLIIAGVHGNELSSQAASFKLINKIYKLKSKIKGTIYIIPILSPKSTSSNIRYYNNLNLNSVANKKGTLSYKIINYAKSKKVDVVGDFHCSRPGGNPGKNIIMGTYLPCESSSILAKYIAKQTKNPYLIYEYAGIEYPGAIEDVFNLKNIPAITCEVVSPHGKIKSGSILKSYKMMLALLKYCNI